MKAAPKKPAAAAKKAAPQKIEEEDSEEDSDEEVKPATKKATTSQVKKAQKVEEEDDDEDEEEEKPAPAKPAAKTDGGDGNYEAKIFGLSFQATENDVTELLKDCGDIANINLLKDRVTGRSRGIAFVKFANEDGLNAALELNNCEHMGRYLEISKPEPRNFDGSGQKPFGQRGGNSFGGGNGNAAPAGDSATCFIGNLSYGTTADTLRAAFESCGGIVDVRVAMDKNTGEVITIFK